MKHRNGSSGMVSKTAFAALLLAVWGCEVPEESQDRPDESSQAVSDQEEDVDSPSTPGAPHDVEDEAAPAPAPGRKPEPACAPAKPDFHPGSADEPPYVCKQVLLDAGSSCIPDIDVKKLALEACARGGLTANAIKAHPCPGGQTSVVVECCHFPKDPGHGQPPKPMEPGKPYPGEKPVPPPKGEPYPPKPTSCEWSVFGDGTKCYSDSGIKEQALYACNRSGLALAEVHPANDCEGGSTLAKYACCGAIAPEPPKPQPTQCEGQAFGGGTKCYSYAEMKEQMSRTCSERGLMLSELHSAMDCDGGATVAKFSCCALK